MCIVNLRFWFILNFSYFILIHIMIQISKKLPLTSCQLIYDSKIRLAYKFIHVKYQNNFSNKYYDAKTIIYGASSHIFIVDLLEENKTVCIENIYLFDSYINISLNDKLLKLFSDIVYSKYITNHLENYL